MKRFNQKEIKKKRYTKSTWYNWLINYVPGPIRQTVGGFKGKGVCIFKTNTAENYSKQNWVQKEIKQIKNTKTT